MPSGRVLEQLARNGTDNSKHRCPGEHLGVTRLVELRCREVENGIDISTLEFRDHPVVKLKLGRRILRSPRIMRHSTACDHGNSFLTAPDHFGDLLAAQRRSEGSGGK